MKSGFDRETLLAEYQKARAEAKKLLGDPERLEALLASAEEKLSRGTKADSPLAALRDVIALTRAYADGSYTDVPSFAVPGMLGAVVYYAAPNDLIPDMVPFAGYTDDAALTELMLELEGAELERWRRGGTGREDGFLRRAPHELGIPESALTRMLADIAASHRDVHSVMVLRGDAIALEYYFEPYTADTAHAMYSASKTVTSMCVGIAAGKGLLSLTDPVAPFFSGTLFQNTVYMDRMKIHDLLCMGTGHSEDTFGHMAEAGGSWANTFLNQPVEHEPGTHFIYNTGATYMLGRILTKVTGKSLLDLADEWIFRRIGVKRPVWLTCPEGYAMAGLGLYLTARDMAKFGMLIMNGGRWNGEQVIPEDYIRLASSKQIDNSAPSNDTDINWHVGYGYQMWRCSYDAFRADGLGGQYIVMMPEKELMFVFTDSLGTEAPYPLHLAEDVLSEVSDEPVPAGTLTLPAQKKLDRAYLPELGAEYVFEENAAGLKSIAMTDDTLTVRIKKTTLTLPYAGGRTVRSETLVNWMGVAPKNRLMTTVWSEDRLYIRVNEYTEPATLLLALSFSGADVTGEMRFTMGSSAKVIGKKA